MACGVNASVVPCLKCLKLAERIFEGYENDRYRCSSCGYEFLIDWSYDGAPQKPCRPIPKEETEQRKKMAVQMFGIMSGDKALSSTETRVSVEKSTKKAMVEILVTCLNKPD
jgi:transposase-like protein